MFEHKKCKLISYKLKHDDDQYQISDKLFNNFKRKEKKPRIVQSDLQNEIDEFLNLCKSHNLFQLFSNEDEVYKLKNDNIQLMNEFYDMQYDFKEFFGENNSDTGLVTSLNKTNYYIPPQCKFFNKNILNIEEYLSPNDENKFDFIVLDPPWTNRYIKRLNKTRKTQSYFCMTDNEIEKIPLEKYTHKSSVVIIWSTNSNAHKSSILHKFLHKWNLKLIANWNWIKIDKCGNLFCSLEGSKKPYETLFIATHVDNDTLDSLIEKDVRLFSHPSSIHSHKPHLVELFRHVLPLNPKCLELFARSLYTNFTSIGTEVLKLQNVLLYDKVN
jgi:N(6)-adenine-specific DNA methyltransferase